jgi:hypothetical protein
MWAQIGNLRDAWWCAAECSISSLCTIIWVRYSQVRSVERSTSTKDIRKRALWEGGRDRWILLLYFFIASSRNRVSYFQKFLHSLDSFRCVSFLFFSFLFLSFLFLVSLSCSVQFILVDKLKLTPAHMEIRSDGMNLVNNLHFIMNMDMILRTCNWANHIQRKGNTHHTMPRRRFFNVHHERIRSISSDTVIEREDW